MKYLVLVFLALVACRRRAPEDTWQPPPPSGLNGATLARTHCGSCHVYPEPALLPQRIWTAKVLPNMGTRMGFQMGYPFSKLDPADVQAVMNAHVIPDHPTLHEEDMFKIVQFYAETAPTVSVPPQRSVQPARNLTLFQPQKKSAKPISTQNILIRQLPDTRQVALGFEDKGAWLCDPLTGKSRQISKHPASDAQVWGDQLYLLDLLRTQAYNLPRGVLWSLPWQQGNPSGEPKIVLDSLIRPVSLAISDVNADQQPDFLVCEFGDYLGRLALWTSSPSGYHAQLLKNYPGACKAFFTDLNADGRPDIAALMSQGREELLCFLQKSDGSGFEERSVTQFPPCYGSNSLAVADVNGDGQPDLITTHGDNADISSTLKAYHGVRVFLNKGNAAFAESWFYPVHGASAVQAADFDLDGRVDLAVIAHFPDFAQPLTENFVFFKQKPGPTLDFTPQQLAQPLNGRLLTLEATDVDADCDTDLLIGNYIDRLTNPDPHYQQWLAQPNDFWVLKNQTLKK